MFKLNLAALNLWLGQKSLDCAKYHFTIREELLERSKALDGYTPMMKLKDRYHAIWCYSGIWFTDWNHKIFRKLIPSNEE